MKSWVQKYAPERVSDIVGRSMELPHLLQAINSKKTVLLYGPPGVGKTATVYALAHDLNLDVLEVNASDFRNADAVESVIGGALKQGSLFNRGKLILVDELDGIAGTEDRGGIQALQSLIDHHAHAVVLVANDPWDKRLATLRKKCMVIEFKKLRADSVAGVLKKICDREGVHATIDLLKTLARRSGGDARAAINDLQSVAFGKKELHDPDLDVAGQREQEENIFEGMRKVFKSSDAVQALTAFDGVDVELKDIGLWMEENLPLEYTKSELARGFDALSRAYVHFGRIIRRQHWRFLVYASTMLTAGIAVAREKPSYGYTPYKRHQRVLKIWMANQKNLKKKEIAVLLKPEVHCSTKRIIRSHIPYLRIMARHGVVLPSLNDEQRAWLAH